MLTEYHQKTRSLNMIKNRGDLFVIPAVRPGGAGHRGAVVHAGDCAFDGFGTLDGGLSHLFDALLDTYMFSPEGVNLSVGGVALALASRVFILRSTSVIFLGDEPALAGMCLA